jgi:hypothetical protein
MNGEFICPEHLIGSFLKVFALDIALELLACFLGAI